MKLISIMLTCAFIFAGSAAAQKPAVFSTEDGAVNGYDVVAYFTDSAAIKGHDSLSYEWQGASWKFSSAANRERFKNKPESFAPLYGGYCAYGLSNGYKAPTSPDAWTISNGKLYLNYNTKVREEWKKDMKGRIQRADANWSSLKDK